MIAFYFFYDTFYMNDGENTCTTLFQCTVCMIHFVKKKNNNNTNNINIIILIIINFFFFSAKTKGLRLSGGISDALLVQSFESENRERYYVRFLYDLVFFAFIRVVFLNIIFGIIVDTFACKKLVF